MNVGDIILITMDQDLVNAWNSGEHGTVEIPGFWPAEVEEEYPAVVQKVWKNGTMAVKVWPIGNGAIQLIVEPGDRGLLWREKQ